MTLLNKIPVSNYKDNFIALFWTSFVISYYFIYSLESLSAMYSMFMLI